MSSKSSVSSGNHEIFTLIDVSSRYGAKIWKLVFDLPGEKVNKLNRKVLQAFESLLPELERRGKEGQIEALVLISGKPGNFIAGADIELIQAAQNGTQPESEAEGLSRQGQQLLDRWEDLPFPTVAAIQGAALGGGCEFSLASSAIVMSSDSSTRIGLPEVMLGIIPGMGGCVRLPGKVGIAGALDLILSSKNLTGDRAFKMGLAEACVPQENFEENALSWVARNLEGLKTGRRLAKEPKLGGSGGAVGTLLERTPFGRMVIFKKAREGVLSKTKGHYPAPLEAIRVIQENGLGYGRKVRGSSRDRAMKREAAAFGRMAATEVSRNLIRLFFMTEAVKKSTGVSADAGSQAIPVRSAGVLGAGVMGGGIAQLFAQKDVSTRMKDLNNQALATGLQSAAKIFQKQVQRKRLTQREYVQKMNHIAPVTDYAGFRGLDFVVEAIVEKMEVKQSVLKDLEKHVEDDCVIASNTSSLSISEMQKAMARPERFAGMHFFNPVSKMPLIEVIRGEKSSDRAVSTVYQFSKALGKTPIVVKDAPGFLVNRLLMPYLNEATWMLADGASIPELDRAMLAFGMPMGPMELIDEVGVDVGDKVAKILFQAFGPRAEPSPFNGKIVEAGRLGKKNGKGLYVYTEQGRKKTLDPEVYSILGVQPKEGRVSEEEIVDRCVLPMINEACRCLEESVVATSAEVDLGMIMGTGFPPFRGGLLRYADHLGAVEVLQRLEKYQAKHGVRFEPSAALKKRVASGERFYR